MSDDFGFTSAYNSVPAADNDFGFESASVTSKPKKEEPEGWLKSTARTLYQIPSGVAQAFTYPLDIFSLLASGEKYDPQYKEMFEEIYGHPQSFEDRQQFLESAQETERYLPNQGNFERLLEEYTGAPLTPKNELQKSLKFISTAGKIIPGKGITDTGQAFTRNIPTRATIGTGLEVAKQGLKIFPGLPEPLAEILAFAELGPVGASQVARNISLPSSVGYKTKPSGLPVRRFESPKINAATPAIPESKLLQINDKLKKDFTKISDEIINNSPIGETFNEIKNNPALRQENEAIMNEAASIAESLPNKVANAEINKEVQKFANKQKKGITDNEYDESYSKFAKEIENKLLKQQDSTASQIVEQYRKNNKDLGEYFKPGESKAFNRAKADSILDYNRALADIIETKFPNSELGPVFRNGNERWKKMMDAETIDEFITDIFSKGIDYKHMRKIFTDKNYRRVFERSMGKPAFNQFESLIGDMLSSEKPYSMLKVAKDKGFNDLYKTGMYYMLHPKLAFAKGGFELAKNVYKKIMNIIIDKPQLTFKWKDGIDALKKGNFAKAEKDFTELNKVVKPSEILGAEKPKLTAKSTPKEKAKKAFEDYGLSSFIEEAVDNGFVTNLDELEKYIMRSPTLAKKAEAIQKETGRTLKDLFKDIISDFGNEIPTKGERINPKNQKQIPFS